MSSDKMDRANPQTTGRIDEFDGLRGCLALWVAASHIFCWCGFANLPNAFPNRIKQVWIQFSYASAAVDTFIILSGFVISYLLHTRPQSYRQFMTGRFFRIYPIYLLCLLLGLIAIYQSPFILNNAAWNSTEYLRMWVTPVSDSQLAHTFTHLFAHVTLLFGLIPEKMLPGSSVALLAPAWSITLEWQYYLVAPLLAWLIYKRSGLLILSLIGCCEFIYSHFWNDAFLPNMLPLFLAGIGSFHFYLWANRQGKIPNFSFAFIAVLGAIIMVSWHWIALGIWTLTLGCVLVRFAGVNEDKGGTCWLVGLRQAFLWPPLQWLGKISYPLYLVHWPLIIFLMSALLHWQSRITSGKALFFMLFLGLPLIISIAWMLHNFVEMPLMKFGKKFTRV
jgi:peptidoglycan/LPS O-acetylase OafA/YrhL